MTTNVAGRECYLGCDVSRWQGGINYNVFNLDFVIYKATGGDGGLYTDGKFYDNAAGFNSVEGAYHFASKAYFDPVVEADYFCKALLSSSWASLPANKKLPPTLDWEPVGGQPANSAAWCLRFLERVEAQTGLRPFIYTAAWCAPVGSAEDMAKLKTYDFWLASYVPNPDAHPCPPWGTNWTAWQYSSTGSVSGVTGNCDMDAFRADRFNAILGGQPTHPTVEEDIMASLADLQAVVNQARDEIIAAVKPADTVWMATHAAQGRVYLVINMVKYHVPDPAMLPTLEMLGADNRGVQDAALDALPEGAWSDVK